MNVLFDTAPTWLTPFGAAQVGGATGTAGRPEPGRVVTRDEVIAFLATTESWRLATLSVLADAVAAAMAGGPRVVLGTATVETAAMWVRALSWLMSPGASRAFGWSLLERGHQVSLLAGRSVHLVCVPSNELCDVHDHAIVFDEDDEVTVGDRLGAHHEVNGHRVPVAPWSVLITTWYTLSPDLAKVLTRLDQIAADVEDSSLAPDWPLAMSLGVDSGEYPESIAAATRVVLSSG